MSDHHDYKWPSKAGMERPKIPDDSHQLTMSMLNADKARIDKLARYWNSQGSGHFLMGVWVENKTGSFRDAIDAL